MVPFAAPIVFGAVALFMGVSGAIGSAITIVVAGFILLFVADHFVRPAIIGEGRQDSVPVGTAGYPGRCRAIRSDRTVSGGPALMGSPRLRLAKLGARTG